MNDDILHAAQEYANWAFLQGALAIMLDISLSDNSQLASMPIALLRINELRKIYNIVENTNIQM